MDNGRRVQRVCVELDCLLDTRMGVINSFSVKYAEQLATNPKYFKRTNDKFDDIIPGFPQQDFEDTYSQRTYEHIAGNSVWTPIAKRLQKFGRAIMAMEHSLPDEVDFELCINTYPYKIPKDHLDVLLLTIMEKLGATSINTISLTTEFLTPTFIKQRFNQFIVYDFDRWINLHHRELGDCPIPDIQALHPLVVQKDTGIPISVAVNETRRGFRPVLDICPLPLDSFSLTL